MALGVDEGVSEEGGAEERGAMEGDGTDGKKGGVEGDDNEAEDEGSSNLAPRGDEKKKSRRGGRKKKSGKPAMSSVPPAAAKRSCEMLAAEAALVSERSVAMGQGGGGGEERAPDSSAASTAALTLDVHEMAQLARDAVPLPLLFRLPAAAMPQGDPHRTSEEAALAKEREATALEVGSEMATEQVDHQSGGSSAATVQPSADSLGVSVLRLTNSTSGQAATFDLRALGGCGERYSCVPPTGVVEADGTVDVVIFLECTKLPAGSVARWQQSCREMLKCQLAHRSEDSIEGGMSGEGMEEADADMNGGEEDAAAVAGQYCDLEDEHELCFWCEWGDAQGGDGGAGEVGGTAGQEAGREAAGKEVSSPISPEGAAGAAALRPLGVRLRSRLLVAAATSREALEDEMDERAELRALTSPRTACELHGLGTGPDVRHEISTNHCDGLQRKQLYGALQLVDACKGNEENEQHLYAVRALVLPCAAIPAAPAHSGAHPATSYCPPRPVPRLHLFIALCLFHLPWRPLPAHRSILAV